MSYMQINYETHINQAIGWLENINSKNGGLLNGNFSKAADLYKVKVRDIRSEWEKRYPKPVQLSTLERMRQKRESELQSQQSGSQEVQND